MQNSSSHLEAAPGMTSTPPLQSLNLPAKCWQTAACTVAWLADLGHTLSAPVQDSQRSLAPDGIATLRKNSVIMMIYKEVDRDHQVPILLMH